MHPLFNGRGVSTIQILGDSVRSLEKVSSYIKIFVSKYFSINLSVGHVNFSKSTKITLIGKSTRKR